MFGFSRPTHLYVDPWGRGGYVVPEDLYSSRAAPFGFLDTELPCDCPSCCPESLHDAYARPYSRVYQHPAPASHYRRPQQHPLFSLAQPQQAHLPPCAHPAAHASTKMSNGPAAAAGWHPDCDIEYLQREEPAAVLHQASPLAAARHSGSRPASSHSLGSSSTTRAQAFGQPQEPVHRFGPTCRVHPTPFSSIAQQQPQRQQQPASPAASVASSRGRHSIPVFAGSAHQAAPEQVQVQYVSPAPAQTVAAPQPQPQPQQVLRRSARDLTRAEAATVIQSWWRMRRLARQRPALQALAAAAAQLRSTSSLFQAYKQDSSAAGSMQQAQQRQHISHKQYLELNELAMRVLLALDATSCGVAELRAVRKRLTAAAINLLDDIQASYSAAVNASMELSDDVVLAAVQNMAKSAAGAAVVDEQEQQGRQQPKQNQVQPESEEAALRQLQQGEQQQLQHEQSGDELAVDRQLHLQQQVVGTESQHSTPSATACSCTGCDASLCVSPEPPAAAQQQQSVVAPAQPLDLPAGVRVVLVYPGSRADATTQTD